MGGECFQKTETIEIRGVSREEMEAFFIESG